MMDSRIRQFNASTPVTMYNPILVKSRNSKGLQTLALRDINLSTTLLPGMLDGLKRISKLKEKYVICVGYKDLCNGFNCDKSTRKCPKQKVDNMKVGQDTDFQMGLTGTCRIRESFSDGVLRELEEEMGLRVNRKYFFWYGEPREYLNGKVCQVSTAVVPLDVAKVDRPRRGRWSNHGNHRDDYRKKVNIIAYGSRDRVTKYLESLDFSVVQEPHISYFVALPIDQAVILGDKIVDLEQKLSLPKSFFPFRTSDKGGGQSKILKKRTKKTTTTKQSNKPVNSVQDDSSVIDFGKSVKQIKQVEHVVTDSSRFSTVETETNYQEQQQQQNQVIDPLEVYNKMLNYYYCQYYTNCYTNLFSQFFFQGCPPDQSNYFAHHQAHHTAVSLAHNRIKSELMKPYF